MKNKKRRIERFSLYNYEAIRMHLERMAAKGWMLEKITNFFWHYRRIEPKNIHFAVTYNPLSSAYDPVTTAEKEHYIETRGNEDWTFVCSSAQLYIFCSELEEPRPIERNAEMELSALHASMKKGQIPAFCMLIVVWLLNSSTFLSDWNRDPIGVLSSTQRLINGVLLLMLGVLCVVELGVYFAWYRKAKKVVREQGIIPKIPDTSGFQSALLIILLLCCGIWAWSAIAGGNSLILWASGLMVIYMVILFGAVNGVKNLLSRRNVSKGVNMALTLITSFVVAFAGIGLITTLLLRMGDEGMFVDRSVATYEHDGRILEVHRDILPLNVEDLLDVADRLTMSSVGYMKEWRVDETILLGRCEGWQYPRLDLQNKDELPGIRYTVVDVKVPFLYELCKEQLIEEGERHYTVGGREYREEDAEHWSAKEAYRLYDLESGPYDRYLLFYDKHMVEIRFDWELTLEQKNAAGEKLVALP